ncbi:branched-chain amino acid transport system II carrier protein [Pseudomonas sp. 5P_3.1_Bac2]|uniref:branched-chain amino acid transport system II carrier protein n=1 Tax=Pseudomonas sp. 5P_3.1_Bac2 TaxID=2971617 RepID=UPI0021C87615|nr:branched-chain amino acid transport system II carrier protein [Pseudomonas sp. 5P_3.1_Bac2]MCU1716913.1 branched-chain amino acid transport system II carrier protein [Pseudomonas sp. 5P_3.1_Bac2]
MTRLKGTNLVALGFMTFALFLGAGNIIFPPSAGMAAGDHLLPAAMGFLLTGVGLPLLTVVALARVGGGMDKLTAPIGKVAGAILAVAVYLAIGPLFATPRTAVASFEIGVAPITGNSSMALLLYTLGYFAIVLFLSLNPGQLVDRVGKLITPVLLAGLLILGLAGVFAPAGEFSTSTDAYREAPLVQGFLQGYLTMDALGALVFGIVITTAIRDQGITDNGLVTRYSIIAGIIAAIGLSLVYVSLFYLGATSGNIAGDAQNGGQILAAYVQHTFGKGGSLLLAVVIMLACLTTAVGLLSACGEFFSAMFGLSYRKVVIAFGLFSMAVANQGLTHLISVSVPVLVGLYPLAIVLVALSLADRLWLKPSRVFIPVMGLTFIFGLADGIAAAGWEHLVPAWFSHLPLSSLSMGWLVPALVALLLAVIVDRALGAPKAVLN